MDKAEVFDRLEARFLELGGKPRARELHAHFLSTQELREEAIRSRANADALKCEPSTHPDQLSSAVRYAENNEKVLADWTDPDGVWVVDGGPSERSAREALHAEFRSLAHRAAVVAGVLADGVDPVDAWLHLLRNRDSPHWNDLWLSQLCEASRLMCHQLVTEAIAASTDQKRVVEGTPERLKANTKTAEPDQVIPRGLTKFAELLREMRGEAGWRQADLAKHAGVSRHTIALWETKESKSGRRNPQQVKKVERALSRVLHRPISFRELLRHAPPRNRT